MRPDATDAKSHRTRRRVGVVLALTLIGCLILAPGALANLLTPKSGGSPNANEIHSLYKLILYIAAVVFVVVEGALLYSVYKFRAKKNPVAAQIHGNTRLEVGWTVAAALILVVLTVVTFVKLPGIINPPNSGPNGVVLSASLTEPNPPNGQKLTICVQGRQYIWRYTYGAACKNGAFGADLPYSYTEMVVPTDTTIVLAIQSTDVIHSWWIPSLGGKVDAVPGYTTYTWFKASKVSTPGHPVIFHGQCAQLCGRQHYTMIARVKVVSADAYKQWLSAQKAQIAAANTQVAVLRNILRADGQLQSANGTL